MTSRNEKLEALADSYEEEFGDKVHQLMADVIDVIDVLKEHDDWISVDDELPKKGKLVLVYSSSTRSYMIAWLDDNEKWIDTVWKGCLKMITHWQPLPVPPKNKE